MLVWPVVISLARVSRVVPVLSNLLHQVETDQRAFMVSWVEIHHVLHVTIDGFVHEQCVEGVSVHERVDRLLNGGLLCFHGFSKGEGPKPLGLAVVTYRDALTEDVGDHTEDIVFRILIQPSEG